MSDLKLYNSLTREVEAFKPIKKGQVGLYTCGPTVYDHVHIGNLRTYVFEDTLRRVLRQAGYKVKHVMNITDIEDKIFKRAKDAGVDYAQLTGKYEQLFMEDVALLGIDLNDTKIIRATEAIADMQDLIRRIPNKYVAEDGIYFDITKYDGYGVFEKLDRSHEHHRINNDEYDKDHVADFALWKVHREGEPSWDFELEGQTMAGRPGWHVECSAMSTKYLGQPFDIHTGGVDLKFPHHENEIAQSKAATGKDLANLFVHGEHLLVDGRKMSKSLKNFYTLENIVAKGIDPLAFRLLVLHAHYRSQLNFSWDSLHAAQTTLRNFQAWSDLRFQNLRSADLATDYSQVSEGLSRELQNDLGTPRALSVINGAINRVEQLGADSQAITELAEKIDDLLGLNLTQSKDITAAQKDLIKARNQARHDKQWDRSDELREQLKSQGLELRDAESGTIWSRN